MIALHAQLLRLFARAAGLVATLVALLAAVFACLHLVPRAPRALQTDAAFAPDAEREGARAVREALRERAELPLFGAWPPFDRRALVRRAIDRLRSAEERALGLSWLAWLGAAARAEWTEATAADLGASGLAVVELGLPAADPRYGAAILPERIERATAALLAGDAQLEADAAEIRELGTLLLEPLAARVRGLDTRTPMRAEELERALRFAQSLPAVALGSEGSIDERRERFLAWWCEHAIYLARASEHAAPLAAVLETRFARWIGPFFLGDLGRDRDGRSIAQEIARRLQVTLPLAAAALLLAFGAALPASRALAARRHAGRGRILERALLVLHSAPGFWIALLLLALFAGSGPLGVFPGSWSSREAPSGALARALHSLERAALPVLALALPAWAFLVRQRSAALRGALVAPFARTARMKGLDEGAVLRVHAAPHARFAMWALAGAAFPALVTGAVVVETLFDIPGVGRYAYDGLLARDLSRVLALIALSGIATWLGLELAEWGLARADPRRHRAPEVGA